MRKNRKISIVVLFVFIMTVLGGFSASAANLNDIDGHWAKDEIQRMIDKGAVTGYPDKTFKPDNTITRAEFMTIINKAFYFDEDAEISYKDVKPADWFFVQVQRAQRAGYITGYEDNTMRPNNDISRQEAALIVSRILNMDTNNGTDEIKQFTDAASIPDWSRAAIGAVVKLGYMNGYPDKSFKPQNPITRAEAVVVISRCLVEADTIFNQPGTYGPETGLKTIDGDAAITVSDVVLQNMIIRGDLTITPTVAEGDFTLKNVTVEGTTYVNGGGANSGTLDGFQGIIIVNKDGVRLIAAGGTTVDTITLNTFATLEESTTLTGGGFYNLVLNDSIPPGTTVIISGDFDNVTVNAPDITLQVESGSITDLEINQAADVTGKGSIKNATVNSAGVNIAQVPDKTVIAEGMTATVGGKEVEETYTKPPETSGGGGGVSVSSDATLASLTISAGTLAPAFQAGITEYTTKVGNSISSVTVTPTVSNNKATVTVADKTVISGQISEAFNLAVGENSLKVVVKAQDGTEKTYKITITRASDSIPDIVNQLQEIYEYIDDADKGDIQNARAEIGKISSSDWDNILVNLLTNEVKARFNAVGKDAKTEMVAFAEGLGNIYYSKDTAQLEATLRSFRSDFGDSFQVLFGTEIFVDDLYDLLVVSKEKLPEIIKSSGYINKLAFGTDSQLVDTIPEVMKDAVRQAINENQFSQFKGKLNEISWSAELLITERVKLSNLIDPQNEAELALGKAVVRSETEFEGVVNNSEAYHAKGGTIYLDLATGMKSYQLKIMDRNATGLVDWFVIANGNEVGMVGDKIDHNTASIEDNNGTLEITPIANGEIDLVAVRAFSGATVAKDWIFKIKVKVE